MTKLLQTPLDLLLPYQRRWFQDRTRFKAGVWSRQTGKDFSSAAEIVADSHQRPRNTWMIAAPSERQSLETLGKCREWSEAFGVAIADMIEDRDAPNTLLKSGTIVYPNGSRIIAVPGKPDTVRGFSANVLLTEFAFFEDPEATWRAIYPSISNPLRGGEKVLRVISTPNGKSGAGARFHKIVDENLLNPVPGRKSVWSVHRVTIEDAVRDGLPFDVAEMRSGIDDETAWSQEYMCEFLDSANVLLPYDLIALAESASATEVAELDGAGQFFIGIDFGRTTDPTICWTIQREGELLITREVLVLRNMATDLQEEILRPRLKRAARVCLDYTGPGIGLGDYVVRAHGEWNPAKHQLGKVELCTFTAGLKREMFPRLRRAFEAPTRLRIPISVEIREDLHAMQQIVKNGEYSYAAPRTAEGHSDRCTALALAVRAAAAQGPAGMPVAFHPERARERRALRESGAFA
jgi:phage FluMu gp28-like protein